MAEIKKEKIMKFDPSVLTGTETLIYALRTLYSKVGYQRYPMGKFEEYDLYSKHKDFLVSDRVITFTDTNGKLMALKPDVTLSLIENSRDIPGEVQKLYYDENVYRVSKRSGGFSEIMQAGLECIGAVDENCIREVLGLAAESLSMVEEENYILTISNLEILTELVSAMTEDRDERDALLKYAGEKNLHGIRSFAAERGLCGECTELLQALLRLHGSPCQVIPKLRELFSDNAVCGLDMSRISAEIDALAQVTGDFDEDIIRNNIRIDFSLVVDINYYNGIIFAGFVEGVPESVLAGGQYDRLMRIMHRKSKAIGFAVYLDALGRITSVRKA